MSAQDLFNAYEDDMPPNFVPVPVLPSISTIRKSSSKEDDATLSLIASERRKKHLPSTIKLLNDTERVIARKRSLIEFINLEDESPITGDYSPNYYTARPIIIPSSQATAMQNLLTRIKQEPDTSLDSPESNRWWDAHKNNSENPDLNANASSSDPTANNLARLTLPDDRTPGHKDPNKSVSFLLPSPPKKKKTRSIKRKSALSSLIPLALTQRPTQTMTPSLKGQTTSLRYFSSTKRGKKPSSTNFQVSTLRLEVSSSLINLMIPPAKQGPTLSAGLKTFLTNPPLRNPPSLFGSTNVLPKIRRPSFTTCVSSKL